MKRSIFKKSCISSVFSAMLVLSTTSCSDDFLDVDPKGTQTESNYYKNANEALNGLIAVYDPMGWEGDTGSGYANFACLVAASDESYSGGGSETDVLSLQVMNNYNLLNAAVNGPQLGFWQKGFTGVYRANVLLSRLAQGIPGLGEDVRAQYTAEAKVLRAYYYFDLLRLFRNVPLFTEPLSTEELYNALQEKPEVVYAQVEQDLKDAIAEPNLPDQVDPAQFGGRITKGIARALLGKVYLYQEKWDEAAAQFAEVNGVPGGTSQYGYKLLDDFAAIFRPDNKFHSESILEITHTSLASSGWGNTSKVEGLIASTMFGPRSYSGPLFYSGWGGCPITPELYNAIKDDPRFDATINDVKSLAEAGDATYDPGYLNTGWFVRKYAPLAEFRYQGSPHTLNYPQNYIEIRLADTYLMEAEALVKGGGDVGRAGDLLNAVRNRVGLPPVATTLENIYNERRLELATEGHRWYDLVRTGRAATVLASKGFEAGKNEILPIPLQELSNTKLVQNPKYN